VIDALGKIPGLRVQQPEKSETSAKADPEPRTAAVQPERGAATHGSRGH
jgi:hypothetical protein